MANLLESYKNRLAISESVYQQSHGGAKMPTAKKMMIATVMNNTAKFLNEAFTTSAATQKSAIGDWKKFCLNVSTTALPNLILPELVITKPMASMTGFVTYLRFTAGVNKGGVNQGQLLNAPHMLGKMDESRANYTAAVVVEPVKDTDTECVLSWTPVVGTVYGVASDGTKTELTPANGRVTFTANTYVKVTYQYDNVIIPQSSTPDSIPTLTATMTHIGLEAKARRIAVYYSQIAAFQAKQDYGYDLGQQLSTQAQGELAYEIDTEGVLMLSNGAEDVSELNFDSYENDASTNTTYISRSQYYEQFSEIIARARKVLYTRTQKYSPNYMVCGANVLTILPYVKGWNAAPTAVVNGPYFAGTIDGLKVYCSPAIDENRFFFGVNGADLQASAGVYAPYMAIVPTQLLGFADGGNSQGFSTMYDMKLLNTYDRDATTNEIVEAADGEIGEFSYLLCAGTFNA